MAAGLSIWHGARLSCIALLVGSATPVWDEAVAQRADAIHVAGAEFTVFAGVATAFVGAIALTSCGDHQAGAYIWVDGPIGVTD